ncbi:MAG: hypothetical protein MUC97_17540, partial [Bernardetiaceae bacterium]|nr:hypothetical protein [Bernardetiaceae bacterium]
VGEVIFPVGLAGSYTPAGLANTGQTADFRVRVFPNVHEFGLSGAVRNQSTVQRTWEIEPLGPQAGAVDVALRLQWNAADEHLEFYTIRAYMAKHRGQPGQRWERLNSQPTAGNGPFAVVASGIRLGHRQRAKQPGLCGGEEPSWPAFRLHRVCARPRLFGSSARLYVFGQKLC